MPGFFERWFPNGGQTVNNGGTNSQNTNNAAPNPPSINSPGRMQRIVPERYVLFLDPDLVESIEALPVGSPKRQEVLSYFSQIYGQRQIDPFEVGRDLHEMIHSQPLLEPGDGDPVNSSKQLAPIGAQQRDVVRLKQQQMVGKGREVLPTGPQQFQMAVGGGNNGPLVPSECFQNLQLQPAPTHSLQVPTMPTTTWSGQGEAGCRTVAQCVAEENQTKRTMITEAGLSHRQAITSTTEQNIEVIRGAKDVALKQLDNQALMVNGYYTTQNVYIQKYSEVKQKELSNDHEQMMEVAQTSRENMNRYWDDKKLKRELAVKANPTLVRLNLEDKEKERNHKQKTTDRKLRHKEMMKQKELDHQYRMKKLSPGPSNGLGEEGAPTSSKSESEHSDTDAEQQEEESNPQPGEEEQ